MAPYEFWWHGGWWFMWIVPVVFLIVFAILLLRGGPACGWGRSRESERESARDILAQRFARGEITKDQYDDMKRTLER